MTEFTEVILKCDVRDDLGSCAFFDMKKLLYKFRILPG